MHMCAMCTVHARAHVCDVYCTGTCTCVCVCVCVCVCMCVCVCVCVVIGDDRATCKTYKYNWWQHNCTSIHAAYCVLKVYVRGVVAYRMQQYGQRLRCLCKGLVCVRVCVGTQQFIIPCMYMCNAFFMPYAKTRHMYMYLYITMSLAVHVYACRGRHTPGVQ